MSGPGEGTPGGAGLGWPGCAGCAGSAGVVGWLGNGGSSGIGDGVPGGASGVAGGVAGSGVGCCMEWLLLTPNAFGPCLFLRVQRLAPRDILAIGRPLQSTARAWRNW